MIKIPLKLASRLWKNDDDSLSEDDNLSMRRVKFPKTSFSSNVNMRDIWEDEDTGQNVRYIPIQVETAYPNTSTPNHRLKYSSPERAVPVKVVDRSNGPSPPMKARVLAVKPVLTLEVDDESDEVVMVKTNPKKKQQIYQAITEDNVSDDDDDEVMFVKEISKPTTLKNYVNKNERRDEGVKYYTLCRNINERGASHSPREYSKLKGPIGIKKSYKKSTTPLPKWMQQSRSNVTQSRSRLTSLNGNAMTTQMLFNLDEKRNYRELIKKVANSMKPNSVEKPDIFNVAQDLASFQSTLKTQRNSLKELNLSQMGLKTVKDTLDLTKEYDPITVASINSSDSEVEFVPSETSSSSTKVDRVNTLKDNQKDCAVVSKDWLSQLNTKYNNKQNHTQVEMLDVKRVSDIISKVNSEQSIAHLEYKLKHELSLPDSIIEEPKPTVELPPLTLEQEKLVKKALGPGPPGQLLVEKFNLRIHRRDLQTLAGLNWLNDEVINFYMNLLMQRSEERKDLPKVYATNTFFYPKLMQSGHAGLKRWTRKVDIFAHNLMVVPVHLGVHWCLSLIDFREKKISYLDSMGGRNQACLDALLMYLHDEHKDKKGQPFDASGWVTENLKNIPQQMNGSDCGMFACTFAEFSARGADYSFTQAHMPYLRRKAALEILQARLLL
ncbi:sentrin-specific protease 1 isoform X2 [Bicyclus anynana]|uniref:Sentrin-specific protease 1 isoform X2 n=1 Tax=Bicyclus anynana TaxID=110368 RepID=A0ABM3M7H5_BICAN|nr:sentrin-specific protease 1 isoform X2 [Bicyclus anynana]